jgi:hypothetical protein
VRFHQLSDRDSTVNFIEGYGTDEEAEWCRGVSYYKFIKNEKYADVLSAYIGQNTYLFLKKCAGM